MERRLEECGLDIDTIIFLVSVALIEKKEREERATQ